MNLKQKIRVLRKLNNNLSKKESLSYSYETSLGYGGSYLCDYYSTIRENLLKKLNISVSELKNVYKEYEKTELKYFKEEDFMVGKIPKIYYELFDFLSFEDNAI